MSTTSPPASDAASQPSRATVAQLIDALLAAQGDVQTAYQDLIEGYREPWNEREAKHDAAIATFRALRESTITALAAPLFPAK